jgi:anti-sigma regulatory factor (Ser/Thr protein kinase)
MRQIDESRCVAGHEPAVELALQEALCNAVIHGNRMDKAKAVHIRCRCELGKGMSVVVSDQGQGFDPKAVPDPSTIEGVKAEHGRGIHLMKLAMDEVSFDRGGTGVRMWKGDTKAQSVLLLKKKNPNALLKGRESFREFAACPVIGEIDSATSSHGD